MINFKLSESNQLLLNPKISIDEKQTLIELKNEFEKTVADTGYFLIASSGSSQKSGESVKLVALKTESVLNSARRFNDYFNANKNEHWGLVLPEFHVAGLSIRARALLAGAKVFARDWSTNNITEWIQENKICYISMVPTQIYDLVQKQIKAPVDIKKVFVGSSRLNKKLREQAQLLNWPVVETYGMTETASMIAVKETDDNFCVMPGVEVKTENGLLAIRCDSLLSATLQKRSEKILTIFYKENSLYQTTDRADIKVIDQRSVLKLLGRETDYIKILGEGVSLSELHSQLYELLQLKRMPVSHFELLALEDERAGYRLILVVEEKVGLTMGEDLRKAFNCKCRPYEKIQKCVVIGQIPRTELGKLKIEELKRIVIEEFNKG